MTDVAQRSNRIGAAVLGANDGIVSIACLVLGVAGATASTRTILTAGVAGLVAGALSLAASEYVSVSSERDIESAVVDRESRALAQRPEHEQEELAALFVRRGIDDMLAREVAEELTHRNALEALTREEYGIEPGQYLNPWVAAASSLLAFTAGALLPLLAMALLPAGVRGVTTFAAVLVALLATGYWSGRVGGSSAPRAVARNVAGGAIAMAVTYAIGLLIGGIA